MFSFTHKVSFSTAADSVGVSGALPQYGSLAPADRPGSSGPVLVAQPHGERDAVGHAGLAYGSLDVVLYR